MKISVYITSYNQKHYLAGAIDSVLAQTLRPHQIIVVDDLSSDGSQELIRSYAASYPNLFTPILHEQNTGVSQVRVDALHAVTGDHATYVDGDDRFLPTKLEKEAEALRKDPDAQIAFSRFRYIDQDGKALFDWGRNAAIPHGNVFVETFGRTFPERNEFRYELVNYQAWKQIGFHDTSLRIYEDWDVRIPMAQHMRTVFCDEVLSEYRVQGAGLSSARWIEHIRTTEYIYAKHRHRLKALTPHERRRALRGFAEWYSFLCQKAGLAALDNEPWWRARIHAAPFLARSFRWGIRSRNMKLLLRWALPHGAYRMLSVVSGQRRKNTIPKAES